MKSAEELLGFMAKDSEVMEVLGVVRSLQLPQWWIGGGFVRNRVWDFLSGIVRRLGEPCYSDIDVVYFDRSNSTREEDRRIEARLLEEAPGRPWTVSNQARMHFKSRLEPFTSCADGIAHWTETATTVSVSMTGAGEVRILAPFGVEDLLGLRLRPTPFSVEHPEVYRTRIREKGWQDRWPGLDVQEI